MNIEKSNDFSVLGEIVSLMKKVEDLQQRSPVASRLSVSAGTIYNIVQEILDILIFQVSSEHFRSDKKNPGIKVDLDKVDELGNTLHKVVQFRRNLAEPVAAEIKGLFFIKKALITLYRNRVLKLPTAKASSQVESVHDKQKSKSPKIKRRRNRRRRHYVR